MRILFILFLFIPIIEMWLLIEVGSYIGSFNTIFLVVLTAFIGILLLKRQGANTLLRARNRFKQGQIPAREMVDGLFFGVAGALLLTPGFFTDVVGFACLIPGIRMWIIVSIGRYISLQVFGASKRTASGASAGHKTRQNTVFEGEIDDRDQRSD